MYGRPTQDCRMLEHKGYDTLDAILFLEYLEAG
jgi:hypothetical protein